MAVKLDDVRKGNMVSFSKDIVDIDVSKSERIYNKSLSRGNQLKWYKDSLFIKLDCLGYESIAEAAVSHFIEYTDLPKEERVIYHLCRVIEDGVFLGNGCFSYDYVHGDREVTISKVLDMYLQSYAIHYDDLRDLLIDTIHYDCKPFVDRLLCLDSITRNDDRHFKNIILCQKSDGTYRGVIADNGGACMSDMISYPMEQKFLDNFNSIQAKPFSVKFEAQLHNPLPLLVDYTGYVNSICYNSKVEKRAVDTILQGLKLMEGIAWERV